MVKDDINTDFHIKELKINKSLSINIIQDNDLRSRYIFRGE